MKEVTSIRRRSGDDCMMAVISGRSDQYKKEKWGRGKCTKVVMSGRCGKYEKEKCRSLYDDCNEWKKWQVERTLLRRQ